MWLPSQPQRFEHFQRVMTVQRAGTPTWLSSFPFKEELGNFNDNTTLVDVGGGFGHQCIALKQAFPVVSGKLILQDLPQTLADVPAIEGVETQAHNFFEPQVVKGMCLFDFHGILRVLSLTILLGAKFYYLRNILHAWPDEKAIIILQNFIPALGPESRILIDDMVLPNEKVHWQAASIDLVMMAALASKERTDEQWRALVEAAGLQILEIFYHYAWA
jgi:demethylsterigmatocystin 6-O-methyltransferase